MCIVGGVVCVSRGRGGVRELRNGGCACVRACVCVRMCVGFMCVCVHLCVHACVMRKGHTRGAMCGL